METSIYISMVLSLVPVYLYWGAGDLLSPKDDTYDFLSIYNGRVKREARREMTEAPSFSF